MHELFKNFIKSAANLLHKAIKLVITHQISTFFAHRPCLIHSVALGLAKPSWHLAVSHVPAFSKFRPKFPGNYVQKCPFGRRSSVHE
jgi:hypothetical protein